MTVKRLMNNSYYKRLIIVPADFLTQGGVSRKSRKLYGSEKRFVKRRPVYFLKLVYSYVVKGIKIEITAKFLTSRPLRFEGTKRIRLPEKFRDTRETGPTGPFLERPESFRVT